MAAGDLYKALAQNQFLQPTANNIKQFFYDQERRQGIKDLIDLATRFKDKISGSFNPAITGLKTPNVNEAINSVFTGAPMLSALDIKKQFDPTQAQGYITDFTLDALKNSPESTYPILNNIVNMLQEETGRRTPKYKYGTYSPYETAYRYDESRPGNLEIINRGIPKKTRVDSYIDENGHRIVEYSDGTTEDKGIDYNYIAKEKQLENAANREERLADENNALGWANYGMRVKEYEDKAAEKKANVQNEYNDIMGSEWMSNEDLQSQDPTFIPNPNFGGAYVVYDPGSAKPRYLFTDQELESYAKNKTKGIIPNPWSRKSSGSSIMTKSEFIADFQKEVGRQPTTTEIEKAKQKGYWK